MRSVRIVICIVVLAAAVSARAGEVGGIVSTDTSWTAANSPYVLTKDIRVSNATLTLEPGVRIQGNDHSIYLIGAELRGIGEHREEGIIVLHKTHLQSESGKNTLDFQYAVLDGCCIVLQESELRLKDTEILASGRFSVRSTEFFSAEGCTFEDTRFIAVRDVGRIMVGNSTFHACDPIEIGYWGYDEGPASVVVQGNTFRRSGNILVHAGVYDKGESSILVRNNIFRDYAPYTRYDHDFTAAVNLYFLYNVRDIVIQENSFMDAGTPTVFAEPYSRISVNAAKNFWNTLDESRVEQAIYDAEDNSDYGKVEYLPISRAHPPGVKLFDPTGLWSSGHKEIALGMRADAVFAAVSSFDAQGKVVWDVVMGTRKAENELGGELMALKGRPWKAEYTPVEPKALGSVQATFITGDVLKLKAEGKSGEYTKSILEPEQCIPAEFTGWWWAPQRPGSGVFIDPQAAGLSGRLFDYREDGSAVKLNFTAEEEGLQLGHSYTCSLHEENKTGSAVKTKEAGRMECTFQDAGTLQIQRDGRTYTLEKYRFEEQ